MSDINVIVNPPPQITAVVEDVSIVATLEIAQGPAGPPGASGSSYSHTQSSAANIWNVVHNLGRYPAVTVVDSSGDEIEGEIKHLDVNTVRLTFSAPFSGFAEFS